MLLESLSRPCFALSFPFLFPWTAHVERPHGLPKLPYSANPPSSSIDPSRNMLRFYQLELLPDMFGGVLLIREWSRIGSRGQYKARWFDDPAAANPALFTQARRNERRGYAPSAG
jgi:predicted DNA-binding WGR domain protein